MSDLRPHPDDRPSTAGMDELLCEYVDGTMESDVRAVFEECLQSDEELAREVHRLRNARSVLSQYGDGQLQASERAKQRLQDCLEASSHRACNRSSSVESTSARFPSASTMLSAVALAFVVGLCAGGLLFGRAHRASISAHTPSAPVVHDDEPFSAPAAYPSLMAFPASRPYPALSSPFDSATTDSRLRPVARWP